MTDVNTQRVDVPLVWVGVEELPVQTCTHFIAQVSNIEEIILIPGQVTPPILTGTQEQRAEQARSVDVVRGRPLARLGLTTTRVRELIKVLTDTLEVHESMFQRTKEG